ncbi:EPHB1 protein, partial [Horornis vulcanius]|nr:EPHB1 protein [Horornis vulcanius]
GAGLCVPCPPNSRSSAEASPVCACRNGYYRADFDPPAAACTSEYGLGARSPRSWDSSRDKVSIHVEFVSSSPP